VRLAITRGPGEPQTVLLLGFAALCARVFGLAFVLYWWRRVRVDEIRVILLIPCMELKDQATVTKHLIVAIAVLVLRERVDSQQLSVPSSACPHVSHGDRRL